MVHHAIPTDCQDNGSGTEGSSGPASTPFHHNTARSALELQANVPLEPASIKSIAFLLLDFYRPELSSVCNS